jgi:hypothetical protein
LVEQANGSTPWHQTSWPLVQETANLLGVPADVIGVKLKESGYYVGPTDRLPFDIVAEAALDLIRDGYKPQRLMPIV